MVLDPVRRVAVRNRPERVAGVQIDRGDAAIRRLEERQPLRALHGAVVSRVFRDRAPDRVRVDQVGLLAWRQDRRRASRLRSDVEDAGFRVGRRTAGDVRAAARTWAMQRAPLPKLVVRMQRRHEHRPVLVLAEEVERVPPQLGREID